MTPERKLAIAEQVMPQAVRDLLNREMPCANGRGHSVAWGHLDATGEEIGKRDPGHFANFPARIPHD